MVKNTPKIRVLSWNIWCDGYFKEISDFLEDTAADIVCLQEVLPHSKNIPIIDFMKSIGYQNVYGKLFDIDFAKEGPQEMGNAIFSKHKIVSSHIHILSTEPESRSALQADIEISGKIVHIFSVHLKHTHQEPSALQKLQADNLIKILPKGQTIVAGDFNATPSSDTIKAMRVVLSDTDTKNEPTWSLYPEGCEKCMPDSVYTRLDYIFTTPDIVYRDFQVGKTKGSDHLPVLVNVTI